MRSIGVGGFAVLVGLVVSVALAAGDVLILEDESLFADQLEDAGYGSAAAAAAGALEAYRRLGQVGEDDDGLIVIDDLDGVPERMRRDLEARLEQENELRRAQLDAAAREQARRAAEQAALAAAEAESQAEAEAEAEAERDELPEYDDSDPFEFDPFAEEDGDDDFGDRW